ncbi:MAG: hypothetical protein DRI75_08535 [Bacteroidetes bacterium]|nr:MAG: hypothetical protein DRI75_08535 [Bacteroidota bacterium]
MRIILLLFALTSCSICNGQENEKISIMFFVQVLNDNYEEAIFYYQNNWKVTGEMSLERGLIESFQILETPYSDEEPFHIVLIYTFKNKELYDNREEPYLALVKEMGGMRLLNDKKPDEFRKVLFRKRSVKHLN